MFAGALAGIGFWVSAGPLGLAKLKKGKSSMVEPRGLREDIFDIDINVFLNELLNYLLCANLIRLSREKVIFAFAGSKYNTGGWRGSGNYRAKMRVGINIRPVLMVSL